MNIILVWVICTLVTFILLVTEIWLSRKKRWVYGLIPVLVLALAGASLYFYGTSYRSGYYVLEDEYCAGKTGMSAEITVKRNINGKLLCFSPLMIKNPDGTSIDSVYLDDAEYSNEFYKEAAEYFSERHNLKGDCMSWEAVEGEYAYFGKTAVDMKAFTKLILILSLPLLITYIVVRVLRKKQKLREELKQLNIRLL